MRSHSQFIQEQKKFYRNIGHVICPALGNAKIFFNNKGFTHLLRKNQYLRPIDEQIKRLALLPHCIEILLDPQIGASYKILRSHRGTAEFWGLEKTINSQTIRVVIRKVNNGTLHFFGVYVL